MQNIDLKSIDLIIGGLFLAFIASCIYFFYKRRKKTAISDNIQEDYPTNTLVYKRDVYIKKLSLKEKVELSWKFLYEITELIVTKFSIEDKNAVNEEGHKLLNNAMRYEHVVDFGIKPNLVNISTNIEANPTQQQGYKANI